MQRWLLLVLHFLAAVHGVRLAEAEPLTDQRAVLELSVNGVTRGEALVVLRGDDVLIPLESLREAGLERVLAPTEQLYGSAHVSLRNAAASLTFELDEQALTLSIVAKPSAFGRTTVDLGPTKKAELRYEYDPSLFVNYAPRLIDGRDFQTFGELGFALGPVVADTTGTYDPERGATRLSSQVSFDDREHLRTATLGDTMVSTGPLGGSVLLGGLSLSRNYALDPHLIKIPRLGFTGQTVAPATVDVYVNDVLVRRVPVAPGEFELTNITPVSGAGTTRYVLHDAFGQERRLETAYYASSTVLAPGLSEYQYGVGLARQNFGIESFSYAEPTFAARHRFGLTRNLTIGYNAEFDGTRANGGTGLTVAGDFGEVEVAHASSTTLDRVAQRGSAALLGYGYRWPRGSVRTVSRVTSQEYSTLTLDTSDNRALVEQVVATGWVLTSNLSVSTNVAFAWLRDSGPGAQLGTTLNARLSRTLGLQVRGTRGRTWETDWANDVFATLIWSLPLNHSAQLSGHTGNGENDATARLSRSVVERTDVGYEVSGSVGNTNRAAGILRGQTPYGLAAATYTNTDGNQHTLVEASGGAVFVDGDVYFTVPARQSFAVVEVPGVEGARAYLDNREMGRTGGDGRLFIPGLRAYEGNRLRINHADLPLDHGVEEKELLLAPPTRGGAVVQFAARKMRLVRGKLQRGAGDEAKAAAYGTLRVQVGKDIYVSPLGADGEFEFDGIPEGSWRALGQTQEGECVATLKVPSSDELVNDLGTVQCTVPEQQASTP